MKFKIDRIDRFNEKHYKMWKSFLKEANGSTIFHDPDFLSYHGKKFNEHHLGIFKGETLYGIIPLAIFKENGMKTAKSPYGASYGGFVFRDILNYSESKDITSMFIDFLAKLNVNKIIITPSLPIYHLKGYSDTFIFSLLEQGFKIINADITSVVVLKESDVENKVFTSKARNMARKARKANITVRHKADIEDFWCLMKKTFQKHKTLPTHSKEDYMFLCKKFPDKVYCNVAYLNDIPVAGAGIFELNEKNIMSFYLCMDDDYKQLQPLTLVIYETILEAKKKGFDYFDFGTSSVNMKARENIFMFKESFGSIGIFRKTYEFTTGE